jgi:hypothetical protein
VAGEVFHQADDATQVVEDVGPGVSPAVLPDGVGLVDVLLGVAPVEGRVGEARPLVSVGASFGEVVRVKNIMHACIYIQT